MRTVTFTDLPKFEKRGLVFQAVVDTPGVRPRNLGAEVKEGKVTVKANSKDVASFKTPKNVEVESVDAEYVFGRLTVTLVPRAPVVQQIQITVADR